MSTATVRTLSAYQIHELREMFFQNTKIEKIGRIDETGALIVEYSGGMNNYDGVLKTKSIPFIPENKPPKYVTLDEVVKEYLDQKANIEDADFEILPPKHIEL